MSLKRILPVLACLRFDNKENRGQRIEEDPAAAISPVLSEFVQSCQAQCSACELTSMRRVKFRMYVPNRPNKYGIQILVLTEARTNYFCNGYLHTGKASVVELLAK
ncbi:hypothetical protein Trydic_g21176 [Trypoxylus dichotomus]